MFNKRKFNRKTGETRTCKECQIEFHTMKPIWVCKECTNKKHRIQRNIEVGKGATAEYSQKLGRKKTDLEGIGYEERKREWYRKASWLERKVKDRSEWQEFFRNEFERIRNDEKLWNSLTRETLGMTPPKEDKEEKKMGRPSHKDTQWMTWEEYEAGGWGEPEDS